MKIVKLKPATIKDTDLVVAFDDKLDQVEHVNLKRADKISKAILKKDASHKI